MDEYTELMSRHEMLRADWMRRVAAMDPSHEFYSHGIMLHQNGSIRMVAKDVYSGSSLWELSLGKGDTQVRITFASGDTYLVSA